MTTKETRQITGKERAIAFAKLHCKGEDLERALDRIENGWKCHRREQLEPLVVPGFSEIVERFEFRHADNSEERARGRNESDYWYVEGSSYAVRIIPTGEILRYWCPENSAKRFALELEDRQIGPCQDFKFQDEQPPYIGKATEKKIQAWIDYQHRKREAETNYMAEARVKNAQLRAAVLKRFPNAKLREHDGWLSECWYSEGVLNYHVTACEDGGFTRSYTVDYNKVPSAKNQLGIE